MMPPVVFQRETCGRSVSWSCKRGLADVGIIDRVETYDDQSPVMFRACIFLEGDSEECQAFPSIQLAKVWVQRNAIKGDVFRAWPID